MIQVYRQPVASVPGLPMVPCKVSSVLTTYPITELTEESFNDKFVMLNIK